MRNRTPNPRKTADQREMSSSFMRLRENFVLVTSYLNISGSRRADREAMRSGHSIVRPEMQYHTLRTTMLRAIVIPKTQ